MVIASGQLQEILLEESTYKNRWSCCSNRFLRTPSLTHSVLNIRNNRQLVASNAIGYDRFRYDWFGCDRFGTIGLFKFWTTKSLVKLKSFPVMPATLCLSSKKFQLRRVSNLKVLSLYPVADSCLATRKRAFRCKKAFLTKFPEIRAKSISIGMLESGDALLQKKVAAKI